MPAVLHQHLGKRQTFYGLFGVPGVPLVSVPVCSRQEPIADSQATSQITSFRKVVLFLTKWWMVLQSVTNGTYHKPGESAPRLHIFRHSWRSWKRTPYVEITYVRPSLWPSISE